MLPLLMWGQHQQHHAEPLQRLDLQCLLRLVWHQLLGMQHLPTWVLLRWCRHQLLPVMRLVLRCLLPRCCAMQVLLLLGLPAMKGVLYRQVTCALPCCWGLQMLLV